MFNVDKKVDMCSVKTQKTNKISFNKYLTNYLLRWFDLTDTVIFEWFKYIFSIISQLIRQVIKDIIYGWKKKKDEAALRTNRFITNTCERSCVWRSQSVFSCSLTTNDCIVHLWLLRLCVATVLQMKYTSNKHISTYYYSIYYYLYITMFT